MVADAHHHHTRYTLKNSMPFLDDEYPSLLFMVPKHVARQWRFSEGQAPTHTLMGVVVRRSPDNSLLLLDLPLDAVLRLYRRGQSNRDDEVTVRVRGLYVYDAKGRCAELDAVLVH